MTIKHKRSRTSRTVKGKKTLKTVKQRPSPRESATSLLEGSIREGGNKCDWIVKKTTGGSARWVPIESVVLNGWRLLTVDYLAANIGKPIEIYDEAYSDRWPSKTAKLFKWHFTPNGDAQVNRKKSHLIGWLKTRNPPVERGQMFVVLGDGDFPSVQIASNHANIASSNVMNMRAFVKV